MQVSKVPLQQSRLPQAVYCQQKKQSDSSTVCSTSETDLECSYQCWDPQYKKNMDILERVQHEEGEKSVAPPHEERLGELGLFRMEEAQ